ncbi:hypothetical protein A6R68_10835 [Neotoma lepida]|uniref:GPS domain-containing protein n=1 Tax=Neotoma lepida TaxID=56216 RepID=A0A1A6FWS7_NEOLE|nr:hypothetical protein A6R68_10835 [Neotoma lepida]
MIWSHSFDLELKGPDPQSIPLVTIEALLIHIQLHVGIVRQWAKPATMFNPPFPRVSDQSMTFDFTTAQNHVCTLSSQGSCVRWSLSCFGGAKGEEGAGEDTLADGNVPTGPLQILHARATDVRQGSPRLWTAFLWADLQALRLLPLHPPKHTHKQLVDATNESNRLLLYCAFLNFRYCQCGGYQMDRRGDMGEDGKTPSSGEGIWSSQGCALTEGNLTHSVCHCTHLTNFAILMQVVPLQLTRGHQVALSSISYVGCSLSVLCLAATLVTFAVLSSVSTIRNQRYHIHANLSFAVLVAQVLLLISFRVEPGTVPCQVLAVLLHYFFLSAFAWMLVEGLHLYSMRRQRAPDPEPVEMLNGGKCWQHLREIDLKAQGALSSSVSSPCHSLWTVMGQVTGFHGSVVTSRPKANGQVANQFPEPH